MPKKTKKDDNKKKEKQTPWPTPHEKPHLWLIGVFVVAAFIAWWLFGSVVSSAVNNFKQFVGLDAVIEKITGDADEPAIDPDTQARLIDGEVVATENANLVPYAVMMENLLSVRPQSGLSQASVVYEALVEGGATRFMAVFDPAEVIDEIMPVRSARPYYLEWAAEYNALYAHAGGSPKALTVIRENNIRDLEALSRDGVYFWRDTTKFAPHNLVTSSEKMNFALRDKELDTVVSDYQSWIFKDGAALDDRGEDGKTLGFNFSYGTTYLVGFTYDRDNNVYRRSNANQPHTDANTGEQIAANNVIVQLTEEPVLDGGKGRLEIFVGGTGEGWVARDGQMIQATWEKKSNTDRTRFYDLDGNEIELNRGSTWVHIITKTQEVTYE